MSVRASSFSAPYWGEQRRLPMWCAGLEAPALSGTSHCGFPHQALRARVGIWGRCALDSARGCDTPHLCHVWTSSPASGLPWFTLGVFITIFSSEVLHCLESVLNITNM
ncbi:hypothetical protein E2C01_008180 [Portunus trituberculatus]|uniref:Uncharacterized protein n=1 Tax=Portunus trituberculatus TaxID=210409 RepID=A0A5B7D0Y8_PORTR|nr:hypothetical protein [Portunus trituberculatus]